MAEFNDNSDKGSVLMQQALKKYAEGDFEGGDKDRKEANRYFDLAMMELSSDSGKMTQLYGESRNFGLIYGVFEQNVDKLFENKKGKKIIKETYDLIKNNKVLLEQFKIYDLFENANSIDDVKSFVNEATNLIKHHNKKQIKENNEKFINFIRKNKLDEYVMIPEEKENLYEAIEYIILNKKTLNNVNEFVNAQKTITEHIERNNANTVDKQTNEEMLDSFKEKISEAENKATDEMNEEERKLFEEFTDVTTDKNAIFEAYKKKTLDKLNEAMEVSDSDDIEKWKSVYDKVKQKTLSENVSENIVNCAEMIEIYNTINE